MGGSSEYQISPGSTLSPHPAYSMQIKKNPGSSEGKMWLTFKLSFKPAQLKDTTKDWVKIGLQRNNKYSF
jgi:hypothetical protein